MSIGKFFPAVLALLLAAGCDDEQGSHGEQLADPALRSHLGISSMHGRIEIPEDQVAYVACCFEFIDGKIDAVRFKMTSNVDQTPDGSIELQLLWDQKARGNRVTFRAGGVRSSSDASFWNDVGAATSDNCQFDGPDGFSFLAMSQSALEQDGTINNAFNGDFHQAVKEKKYVGVIAVKFFEDSDLASKYVDEVLSDGGKVRALYP